MAVVRDQVAVARVERRVELPHLRVRVERLHDVLDCGLERRIVGGEGLGLDQDDLALLVGRLREARFDDLVRGGGLADGEVVLSRGTWCRPAPPMTTEATTNASQPKTAVFQWFALHRPMRAAMLLLRFRGDMAAGSFRFVRGGGACGWVVLRLPWRGTARNAASRPSEVWAAAPARRPVPAAGRRRASRLRRRDRLRPRRR